MPAAPTTVCGGWFGLSSQHTQPPLHRPGLRNVDENNEETSKNTENKEKNKSPKQMVELGWRVGPFSNQFDTDQQSGLNRYCNHQASLDHILLLEVNGFRPSKP